MKGGQIADIELVQDNPTSSPASDRSVAPPKVILNGYGPFQLSDAFQQLLWEMVCVG